MPIDLLQFGGEVSIQAAADGRNQPRVSIMAYGGGMMHVAGFGPIAIDLAGADVGGNVPLLADHENKLDSIAGQGRAAIRGQQLFVDGILTEATEAGRKVIALAKSGITLQASVGYVPERREHIGPGQTVSINGRTLTAGNQGLTVVRSGKLREVSLLSVGADPNTQVRIAASGGAKTKGDPRMDENFDTLVDQVNAEMRAALPENAPGLTDAERVLARWNREKWHNQEGPRQHAEKAMISATAGRISYADFERVLLESKARDAELALIRASRPQGPGIRSSSRDADGPNMLQAALLCHLGAEDVSARVFGDQATQGARDARMTSLVEILQAAFQVNGQEPPHNRRDLVKAAFSTASISNIVSGAQNKILLDQWARMPLTCLQLCKKVSASDFKEGKAVRLVGRDTMLDQVGKAGEIKLGHLQDSAATYRIDTYARMYSITRQDVINDDLGALAELPRVIARGAGLKMESVFWALVLGNADDFFGEDNGNLLSNGLDITGLGAAVAAMRALTDADGEPILVEPSMLVVPPTLEATANTLYASTNVVVAGTGDAVTTAPSASPFAGKNKGR